MESMTGYGRGECARAGKRLILQVSSVNHRHCDLRFAMARELCYLEKPLRDRLRERVQRGAVQIAVELTTEHPAHGQVQADLHLAHDYLREVERLRTECGLDGRLTVSDLLQMPGILQIATNEMSPETIAEMALLALDEGLDGMIAMRQAEGAALLADFVTRLDLAAGLVREIAGRAPQVPHEYRERLRQRLAELLTEPGIDPDRLAKEVAWFADKADITEEVTRLQSHLEQANLLMAADQPIGRKLDFLLQEMHREVNTISNKANDRQIAHWVVELKTEVERMREQAQNLQ